MKPHSLTGGHFKITKQRRNVRPFGSMHRFKKARIDILLLLNITGYELIFIGKKKNTGNWCVKKDFIVLNQ